MIVAHETIVTALRLERRVLRTSGTQRRRSMTGQTKCPHELTLSLHSHQRILRTISLVSRAPFLIRTNVSAFQASHWLIPLRSISIAFSTWSTNPRPDAPDGSSLALQCSLVTLEHEASEIRACAYCRPLVYVHRFFSHLIVPHP